MLSSLVVNQQITLSKIQGSNPFANIYFNEKRDIWSKKGTTKV